MILLIDAGNTRIKWGLHADGRWQRRGAVPTGDAMQLGACREAWAGATAVVACSVAGRLVEATIEAAVEAALGARAVPFRWSRSGAAEQCDVSNRYAVPGQLGSDRWAALIGAWATVAGSDVAGCLVVCAGTATTVDLLLRVDAARAEFVGGAIVPGLALMRASLARNTAGLPHTAGVWREQPRCTDDAIETGCVEAQLGAIERLRRRLPGDAPVILSGGAAEALARHLQPPPQRIDDLVLEGLVRIAAAPPVLP